MFCVSYTPVSRMITLSFLCDNETQVTTIRILYLGDVSINTGTGQT